MRHQLRCAGPSAAAAAGLLAASLAWLLGACTEEPAGVPVPNRPPSVALSAGPIRDSVSTYVVTFHWNASDPDGRVDLFRYAIDDTARPGGWMATTLYEVTLVVSAADSAGVDSIYAGLSQLPLLRYRFRGAHTFFIEAIDDAGAVSAPAALSFTAETFSPETEILVPSPRQIVDVGRGMRVVWRGTDPDETGGPVGYSYRLVPVPFYPTPAQAEAILDDPASPGGTWSPFEPRTEVRITDLALGYYAFGVRAVDRAGAIEPRLRTFASPGPANAFVIRARPQSIRPTVRVSTSLKTVTFPTVDVRRKTFSIAGNADAAFAWRADASSYGGSITGYSYGIDLADLDESDPGWVPESPSLTGAVLRFAVPAGGHPQEQILYLRVRDDFESVSIDQLDLFVLPPTGERNVLLVDDFGGDRTGRVAPDCQPPPPPELSNPGSDFPQDWCHDQYLGEAIGRGLAMLGHPDWTIDLYDPLDPVTGRLSLRETEIDSTSFDYWVYSGRVTLDNLLRYELVIWNVRFGDTSQLRAMNEEGADNFLAAYVEAGGDVWITGTGVFSRSRPAPESVLAPFGFRPSDFPFRFLRVESEFQDTDCRRGCFRASGQTTTLQRQHGFEGAYPSPRARAEGYPGLRVVRPPFDSPIKGVPSCEGMAVPYGLDVNRRLEPAGGRLDTLYFYQSNGLLQVGVPSYMDGAACALRSSGPGQGRLMMFGFPLYFMPASQVDSVMVASLRWLLE